MKTIIATVGAVMTAVTLGAQEADEKSAENEGEEEETALFEAGVDFDFYSAYVWRNAVQSDRMVMQPCVWADLTMLDPFYFGFSIWQNYDLTARRRGEEGVYRRALTETDYNVHIGVTAWSQDDMSLTFELGHEWYVSHNVKSDERHDCPDTYEVYLKATFDNPFVGVYGQASWMYKDFGCYQQGMHYELGFTKEVDLVEDTLTLGADWNVNFGDSNYLIFLYGGLYNPVEDEYESSPGCGIGGTTIKAYLTWSITDWVALKGTLAYTALVNGDLRQAHGDEDDDNRDFLWGGVSLNFEF